MRHIFKLVILISLINYLPALNAETIISCSHPQLCALAETIFSENHMKEFKFQNLVVIAGDPHEYEPTSAEVKNLIKAAILIAGPVELNPWIKKVNYQRSKMKDLKTLNIPMGKAQYELYPKASHEALSHFWLYPRIYCALKTSLEEQLVANELLIILPKKKSCVSEAAKIESELQTSLSTLKLPIVLTHDALLPLLETLSKNSANVVAIKGSGHHSEASATSVKKLYDALKRPQVIWVEERGINIPQNIMSKKRKFDLTISIDTAASAKTLTYFPILNELNDKIKAISL
jgi:ABC-type Zn uptake system ZnuABC Zn-binding protein ZnuA